MKKGFTLAETLITLGIIGVVATLTLPNLMADYKNKTYVARLQRAYNTLENALQNYLVDQDVDNLADSRIFDSGELEKFMKKYFKVVKFCSSVDGCIPETYKTGQGATAERARNVVHATDAKCISTDTGATFCMTAFPTNSTIRIDLDVDGKKGANVYGRDAFAIYVNKDGSIKSFGGCSSNYGVGCFNHIMEEGWVMDY